MWFFKHGVMISLIYMSENSKAGTNGYATKANKQV